MAGLKFLESKTILKYIIRFRINPIRNHGGVELLDSNDSSIGFSEIAVGVNKDGRLEVFGIRSDIEEKSSYHVTQEKEDDDESWGKWKPLDEVSPPMQCKHIAVGSKKDGRLAVVGIRKKDNVVGYTEQPAVNAKGWTGKWAGTSLKCDKVGVGPNQDGKLEVFGIAVDGKQVHHMTTREKHERWGRSGSRLMNP